MKPFPRLNSAWVLTLTLGLTAAACTGQTRIVPLKDGGLPAKLPTQPVPATEPDTATKATLQAAYGKFPLHFEANQGQSDSQVQFLARGHGYSLFLTSSEAVLALRQPSGTGEPGNRGIGGSRNPAPST